MSWFINSEVLLTNLLERSNGVTYEDIENYCAQITVVLKKKQSAESVLFDLNAASFSEDLSRYPKAFRFSSGQFCRGLAFNTMKRRFQRNTDEEHQKILKDAAELLPEPTGV
ncbi:MAG: hypothetical protein IJK52_08650 [Oscillospiraceae bacterium]|nr:hypothetical protein [Oscillospiraceae bacterium]